MGFKIRHFLTARGIRQREHSLADAAKVLSGYDIVECLKFIDDISRRSFLAHVSGHWSCSNFRESFIEEFVPETNRRFAVAAAQKASFVVLLR